MDIRVGDMIMIPGRFWRVTGIHIGGVGYENVIELEIVDRKPAQYDKTDVNKLLVPEALLTQRMVYRSTESLVEESGKQQVTSASVDAAVRSIPRQVDKPH